jgi:uncharacterized Zn-finger protein
MFGFNSPSAMRMLQTLQAAHATPSPEPRAIRQPSETQYKSRSRRAPSPPSVQSESESDSEYSSGNSASSGTSYESDTDVIYSHVVETKKCPFVSPAGLRSKSSGKEAIQHLKAKNCPEVPALKKSAKKVKMDVPAPAAAAPAPVPAAAPTASPPPHETSTRIRKVIKKKTDEPPKVIVEEVAPAQSQPASPAPKKRTTRKKSKTEEAPAAPVVSAEVPKEEPKPAANGKAKRAPSAYNLFMKEHLKAGKAMTEIAALWKAQKAA